MVEILKNTKNMTKDEWLKWRDKGIGGSDVSIICGLNKFKSVLELWMEKLGYVEHKEAGESAYWGTVLEPIVREEFTNRTGLKVDTINSILKHPKYDFMLANIDGIVNDPIYGKCLFEAKTTSAYMQEQWKDDLIPKGYMLQIQHYMAVTGYERTFIAVLIGGNTFKYKVIERDDELIEMIIKLEKQFWENVKNNTPPNVDGSESSSNLLNILYPKANKENQITLPLEAEKLIEQYYSNKTKEKEFAELKDEAVNKLKMLVGNNEIGTINNSIVSWKNVCSERLDSKRLKEELPEVYKKYLKKTETRRFMIK